MPPSSNTKQLAVFSSPSSFQLLLHSAVFSCGALLLHHVLLKQWASLCLNMEWKFAHKVTKLLVGNSPVSLQYLATAYEGVLWYLLLRVLANITEADYRAILFMAIQLVLILLSKAHLFFSKETLTQHNPYLSHSFFLDQLQNPSVALLVLFSNSYISFSPLALILFATYNLASIAFAEPVYLDPQFKKSEVLAAWQYGASLAVFIAIQSLKCANMWRSSSVTYEQTSIDLGLAIALLSTSLIILNGAITLAAASLRIC
jgi:hypothetical protein